MNPQVKFKKMDAVQMENIQNKEREREQKKTNKGHNGDVTLWGWG